MLEVCIEISESFSNQFKYQLIDTLKAVLFDMTII